MVKYLKHFYNKRKLGLAIAFLLISFFIAISLLFKEYQLPVKISELSLRDWATVIQLVIVLTTSIIAVATIIVARRTSKERATLDVVLSDYKDQKLVDASNKIFSYVREDKNKLFDIFVNKKEKFTTERGSLLLVLNRYEFYAAAINHGILDEKLFKRLHCSNFIKLWDAVSPTVMGIRDKERKDTLFKDLEILVQKWKTDPLSVKDL